MSVYDPDLVGYGTDWWFLHTLGADLEQREFRRIGQSPLGAVTGLLNNFPDRAYLNAKSLARHLGLRARS